MHYASRLALLLLTAAVCQAALSGRQRDLALRVSHEHRTISPGDVVRITVTAEQPLAGVEGEAFGQQVHFWPATERRWHGLAGVDLETRPGRHAVTIEATGVRTGVERAATRLTVMAKRFETRRLTVSTQYASPGAAESERIAREAQLLQHLFARPPGERLWTGPFDRPVPGAATSSFGRRSIVNGERRNPHLGADFRASTGTPVRAPNAGRVVLAEELYLAGNTVVIDHGLGLYSLFAHLSRIAVASDAVVRRGDLLGATGATGRVTGPHLHWAVRLGSVAVDPLSLVTATSARDLEQPAIAPSATHQHQP